MSVKIVSYDLGGPESSADYKDLIDYMRSFGTRAKPLESFWLLSTTKSCTTIRDEAMKYLDSNDKLLVFEWSLDDWATYKLPKDVTDWLAARQ